ncbi:hypothetical protein C9374_003698 [Naegleria lovaniensis]|uniref:Cytochrome c oxidase copper chaperone n=1 Tax=Naegleria lovaniensis TaxID=51637 RepID=A0AA88H5Q6_NAELO|nr:uncharacterized protein C9374_003698 [Naegleria lovaniensis]KAG2393934.1 hypothetical protein C9374_003698 [Naegleria lovaniensis]
MSCETIKSLLSECQQNNADDVSKCKWAEKALQLCTKQTTLENELSLIEKSLSEAPRTPAKKICCSCPDIKKIRDSCLITNGEDNAECKYLITAYRLCLRDVGFSREQANL